MNTYCFIPIKCIFIGVPAIRATSCSMIKRFVSLLYRWHNDEFTEYNKVSDAGSYIKDSIYDFIDDSQKVVIVVDCENSDPYKLSATLRRLNSTYTEKSLRSSSLTIFTLLQLGAAWKSLPLFQWSIF